MMKIASASLVAFALPLAVKAAAITGSYTFLGDVTPQDQSGGPYNVRSSNTPTGTDLGYSVLRFLPSQLIAFQDYTNLTYNYDVNAGGIGGGSPRVAVVVDSNNNGISDINDQDFIINFGPAGSFVDGTQGDGQTTGNLLALTDSGRYDLSDMGGSPYTDRNAALAAAGSLNVLRFSLILDTFPGSAAGDQNFDINSISASAVPEPTTLALFGLGAIGLLARRRRAVRV